MAKCWCWSFTAEISKKVVSCFSICFILNLSLPFFAFGTSWQCLLFLSFSLVNRYYWPGHGQTSHSGFRHTTHISHLTETKYFVTSHMIIKYICDIMWRYDMRIEWSRPCHCDSTWFNLIFIEMMTVLRDTWHVVWSKRRVSIIIL